MDAIEERITRAARSGNFETVAELLGLFPELDINYRGPDYGWTMLHCACDQGKIGWVQILLAHPRIDVNVKSILSGRTPLMAACLSDEVFVVKALLADPRVNVGLEDDAGCTPWMRTVANGGLEVMEWLVASGRDLGKLCPEEDWPAALFMWPRGQGQLKWRPESIAPFLERFGANPTQTRHEVRVKLGIPEAVASELFAVVVFLCDGLLQLQQHPGISPTGRFFSITQRLPMELQMVICHHCFGSSKQNITSTVSEVAFRSLAKALLLA